MEDENMIDVDEKEVAVDVGTSPRVSMETTTSPTVSLAITTTTDEYS